MKKNFRRYVLTIYLLTLAVVSHAQVLKGTASGTVTDIDGRFELKDLKEGNQKLVISYIFYRTAEIDVEVKAENPELNIGLELDGQQLNEVTVIGRKNLESVAALHMETHYMKYSNRINTPGEGISRQSIFIFIPQKVILCRIVRPYILYAFIDLILIKFFQIFHHFQWRS